MTAEVHTYGASLRWTGSTGAGYDHYERAHTMTAPPSRTELALSSDPHFLGDPARLNPEQLLVLSASSCQLLSFLATTSRARLDVVAYVDDATGVMPPEPTPTWIQRIDLRPTITLADTDRPRPSSERLAHLTEVAHRECFIANSVRTEIFVTPTFHWVDDVPDSTANR